MKSPCVSQFAEYRDFSVVRPAAHVSNRCKSGVRPVVGRT